MGCKGCFWYGFEKCLAVCWCDGMAYGLAFVFRLCAVVWYVGSFVLVAVYLLCGFVVCG